MVLLLCPAASVPITSNAVQVLPINPKGYGSKFKHIINSSWYTCCEHLFYTDKYGMPEAVLVCEQFLVHNICCVWLIITSPGSIAISRCLPIELRLLVHLFVVRSQKLQIRQTRATYLAKNAPFLTFLRLIVILLETSVWRGERAARNRTQQFILPGVIKRTYFVTSFPFVLAACIEDPQAPATSDHVRGKNYPCSIICFKIPK